MKISEIISGIETESITGTYDKEITSLGFDSRSVTANQMFFAQKGTASDGHAHIPEAVRKGASAVVCERLPEELDPNVTYIKVKNTQSAMGRMASSFYGNPSSSLKLIGVTGTNGKTTIATLLYDMFRSLGHKTGLISTVVYKIDSTEIPSTHTTPDAIKLNSLLASMVACGCDWCFMEVSSHSIVQERIAGLNFAGGIFTNLTHDHLDYHGTFAEYIRAKKQFFDQLPQSAFALVNSDDRNGTVMIQNTAAKVSTYSLKHFSDFRCRIQEHTPEGMLLKLDGDEVWTRFSGGFNASNLTAVYAAAILCGADRAETLKILSTLTPVRGRFETLRLADNITAIVDYAHTPDALRNVIDTINEIRNGDSRLIVVVGCGGNRDKTKRPEMALIATENTDMAIFTSDNPRNEKPEDILADMTAELVVSPKWLTITDRRQAIRTAAAIAHKGDYILIAGKGHETYQIIGGETLHFDDREEILKCYPAEPCATRIR